MGLNREPAVRTVRFRGFEGESASELSKATERVRTHVSVIRDLQLPARGLLGPVAGYLV